MEVINKKCVFKDERGKIVDILEKEVIEYVTLISSKKGAVRGNHYHKESVQYTFVLKGSLKLLTQMPREEVKIMIIKSGDLVLTPPMEKHTLIALVDSEFLVFTRGPRGGKNYEKDTYRLTEKLTDLEINFYNNNIKRSKEVVNK
jgi:oxalate decarboxylase/phosphoglucose isomerase-like protein (cupin superfamily)